MKPLLNDEELQKLVEMAKQFEQQLKEQCELAEAIYSKYQKQFQLKKKSKKLK